LGIFSQFLLCHFPWAVSYLTTNFGGTYFKIYACFEPNKTDFEMQNFQNLGTIGVGWPFVDEILKRHILGWFHAFWVITHADTFTGFFFRRPDEKGTLQKVTERLYFTYLRGIPHSTKFN